MFDSSKFSYCYVHIINHGRDPFNQNFRKFRSKTQWISSVQPEKFRKKWSTFFRLDRSDRNGPFHLTIPTHFQSQVLAVRYLPCTKWRKILITALLWIVNSGSIGVTRTSMNSSDRSAVASQAKCMYWLLTAFKDDLFPERICRRKRKRRERGEETRKTITRLRCLHSVLRARAPMMRDLVMCAR